MFLRKKKNNSVDHLRYLYSDFDQCGWKSSCTWFHIDPSDHLSHLAELHGLWVTLNSGSTNFL